MKRIEFFYDYASTYSYLAHREIEQLAARHAAELVFRPMVLGFVFKATGNSMPAAVPAKAAYMVQDVRRWVRHYGLPFHMPSVFPVNTIRALRTPCGARGGDVPRLPPRRHGGVLGARPGHRRRRVCAASIASRPGSTAPSGRPCGRSVHQGALKENTDEAIERGVFGAPTFFVGDQMFWGNDRLEFVAERSLTGRTLGARLPGSCANQSSKFRWQPGTSA